MIEFQRVVIIDDNKTSIFLNQDIVNDCFPKSESLAFNHSEEFLEKYLADEDWQTQNTLLLLDINLPGISGYDVLEELEDNLEELANLYVIMVTSSNLKRDWERSSRFHSVIGYIEKPLTKKNLMHTLDGSY